MPIRGYSHPQANMVYFLIANAATAEAALFSSYKALKMGGVIQYDSDE